MGKPIILCHLLRQDTLVVIDWANIFYAQKSLKREIDIKKLMKWLRSYPRLIGIRVYLGYNEKREKERKLLSELRSFGCEVIAKPIKLIRADGDVIAKKGNVDVELAIDTWDDRDQFRTMMLFSGDSDFAYLLKRLRNLAKRCVVVSSRRHVSKELIRCSNKFVSLEIIADLICKEKTPQEGS